MRLVEILARELKGWPESFGDVLGQRCDGTLHGYNDAGSVTWIGETPQLTRCDNYMHDIVTRAQWQEAREASSKPANFAEPNWNEAPEGFDYFIQWPHKAMRGNFYRIEGDRYVRDNGYYASVKEVHDDSDIIVTKRPIVISDKPWSGEGLPPVGTICENVFPGEIWREVIIIAHDGDMAVFRLNNSERLNYFGDTRQHFRPIRTPEQIAAEERSAAVMAILDDLNLALDNLYIADRVYEAGYRKVKDGKNGGDA